MSDSAAWKTLEIRLTGKEIQQLFAERGLTLPDTKFLVFFVTGPGQETYAQIPGISTDWEIGFRWTQRAKK